MVKSSHKLHAFVNIFAEAPMIDKVVEALYKVEELEELYEVSGEFDIVTIVSASNIEDLREILKNKIMNIKGIKSTVTSIALMAHKGPKCET